MKNEKYLLEAIDVINTIDGEINEGFRTFVPELIHEFIVDNKSKAGQKFDIWKAASKEKNRTWKCGMYHDSVASKAVCANDDIFVASSEAYNEDYADTIRDKYGNKIEGRFPDWKVSAEDILAESSPLYELPVKKLKECCKTAKAKAGKKQPVVIKIGEYYFIADKLLSLLSLSDGKVYLHHTFVEWISEEWDYVLDSILYREDYSVDVCDGVKVCWHKNYNI